MDDLISRKAAIELLKDWADGDDYIEITTNGAIADFEDLPPARLPGNCREMIYCEDCKYGEEMNNGKYHCAYHGLWYVERYWYCRDGKWKDE